MSNNRLTPKDLGLLKGSLRRAFARSTLHEAVMASTSIEHSDPKRPRCQRWNWCQVCGEITPRWQCAVDHIEPLVPLTKTFADMSVEEIVDRLWCERKNLQVICKACHHTKNALERKQRPKRARKKKASNG